MTTYAELVDQIRAYTETDANVLTTTIVNDFISNAENRIFREVDLDAFRSYQIASLTANNAFVSLPGTGIAEFALIRSVQIYGQSLGNSRKKLEQKDVTFMNEYWPDRTATATPVYYSNWKAGNIYLAPTARS